MTLYFKVVSSLHWAMPTPYMCNGVYCIASFPGLLHIRCLQHEIIHSEENNSEPFWVNNFILQATNVLRPGNEARYRILELLWVCVHLFMLDMGGFWGGGKENKMDGDRETTHITDEIFFGSFWCVLWPDCPWHSGHSVWMREEHIKQTWSLVGHCVCDQILWTQSELEGRGLGTRCDLIIKLYCPCSPIPSAIATIQQFVEFWMLLGLQIDIGSYLIIHVHGSGRVTKKTWLFLLWTKSRVKNDDGLETRPIQTKNGQYGGFPINHDRKI